MMLISDKKEFYRINIRLKQNHDMIINIHFNEKKYVYVQVKVKDM